MQPDLQPLAMFDYESETLISTSGLQRVQLGTHATRCLDLLLNEAGSFVSNETILDYCWREHGIEVSDTSVRQIISVLRRALAALSIDKKMLLNSPGSGYLLAENVISRKVPSEMGDDLKVFTEAFNELPTPNPTSVEFSLRGKKQIRRLTVLCALSFLFCILVVFGQYRMLFQLKNYRLIEKQNGLMIYSQEGGGVQNKNNAISILLEYERSGYLTLPRPGYIYFNSSWLDDNFSAFICKDALEKINSKCYSLVITGVNK